MGWLFFYAGIIKIADPRWSAEGYLKGAKTLSWFYQFLTQPNLLPITNFLNEWGLTIVGLFLMLGLFTRFGSTLGAIFMALYYLPILSFPHPGANSFIVDQHIIFIFALACLASFRAGQIFGLDGWCSKLPICSKFPKLRDWLG